MWEPSEHEPALGIVQQRNINMLYTLVHFVSYQKVVTINLILAQPCNIICSANGLKMAGLVQMCLTMFVSSGTEFLDSC